MKIEARYIGITDGDMEIVKALEKAHEESKGYSEAINKIWSENDMFKSDPKLASENEELKELNYKSTLVTMKITSLNEALAERIIAKCSNQTMKKPNAESSKKK